MSFNIEVEGGASVRLPTAGKYCDRDIVVTATSSGGGSYDEGYNAGFDNGYLNGYGDGQTEGYEQGEADAIENLPDGYLKVDPAWTDFSYFCAGRRFSLGVNLKYSDTSNGTNFSNMFNGWDSNISNGGVNWSIPSLDLRNGTNFMGMFLYSSRIAEIGEMDISNATSVSNMFHTCTRLERVSFVKNCIKISISFAQSNLLDDASIQSIIDGLADLTGQTAQTLTFHATVGGKLTDAQKATITAKNWTLVY